MRLTELISEKRLRDRISEMVVELNESIQGTDPIVVGILKGSIHFLSDIARGVGENLRIDFMQVSSYEGERTSNGIVQIRKDLDISIEGEDVILVEDIVDTGTTLRYLMDMLATRHPKSLNVVTLLSKLEARGEKMPLSLVGFEIPDLFVVGYGLDWAERYRNLPYIAILSDS